MNWTRLGIKDVFLVTPEIFHDERGFFMEVWRESFLTDVDPALHFVQENHNHSRRCVLRGLHYQIQRPQGKLVRTVHGQIFDVAVDMRKSSDSFGRWVSATLSAENSEMLWIPPGFAHGFYVQSEYAEIIYTCTDYYSPKDERTIRWDDPDLKITWPLKKGEWPDLSRKDKNAVWFHQAESFT